MKIDCHFHFVGDGSSGSGSKLNLGSLHQKFLAKIILKEFGLPNSALKFGLDDLYLKAILHIIRTSSIDKVVLLAMDYPRDENGKVISEGSFYVTNDFILKLARKYSEFLPAVSIHPGREDAIEELEKCKSLGAVGLKLLPNCHNVNCNLPKYKKFWQKLADLKMFFLAHTGGELSVKVIDKSLQNPEVLLLPLECGVNVIAAHCATSSHPLDQDYTDVFIKMCHTHSNLYGDNSALNTPFRSKHFKKILNSGLKNKIIYGSDLPIPTSSLWVALRNLISWKDQRIIAAISNPLERDLEIKHKIGFNTDTLLTLNNFLTN